MTKVDEIDMLVDGLRAASPTVKYGAAKRLRLMSETAPEKLYTRFDLFFRLFEGENTILRWGATRILGNLAVVDRDGRLEQVLDRFLAPILGQELIGAANAIAAAAQVALAKPHVADRIASGILKVEGASYRTAECRHVAIGHAITSLEKFFFHVSGKNLVTGFVRRQLTNPRQATRRKAERFLKRWP